MLLLRILDLLSIALAALVLGVFWGPWLALPRDLANPPRHGDTVSGFVAGRYPTSNPSLPDRDGDER